MGAISEGRKLLDYAQAAEVLGVCESKLRHMVSARLIPFIKLPPGGRTSPVRFDPKALDKWIETHTTRAGSWS